MWLRIAWFDKNFVCSTRILFCVGNLGAGSITGMGILMLCFRNSVVGGGRLRRECGAAWRDESSALPPLSTPRLLQAAAPLPLPLSKALAPLELLLLPSGTPRNRAERPSAWSLAGRSPIVAGLPPPLPPPPEGISWRSAVSAGRGNWVGVGHH